MCLIMNVSYHECIGVLGHFFLPRCRAIQYIAALVVVIIGFSKLFKLFHFASFFLTGHFLPFNNDHHSQHRPEGHLTKVSRNVQRNVDNFPNCPESTSDQQIYILFPHRTNCKPYNWYRSEKMSDKQTLPVLIFLYQWCTKLFNNWSFSLRFTFFFHTWQKEKIFVRGKKPSTRPIVSIFTMYDFGNLQTRFATCPIKVNDGHQVSISVLVPKYSLTNSGCCVDAEARIRRNGKCPVVEKRKITKWSL